MWGINDLIGMEATRLSYLQSMEDSYDALKKITKRISLCVKPIFDVFINNNKIQENEIPQYYCSPLWGEVCSNFKWRYLIVSCDDDFVLVLFRVVGLYSTQRYFTLSYRLLSKSGNTFVTNKVMSVLNGISCIKKMEIISYDDKFDEINFYNTEIPKINNWKLKNAQRLCNLGLSVRVFTSYVPNLILDDIKQLYSIYSDKRFTFDVRTHDKYMKIAAIRHTPVFVFYFKDIVVGVKICSDDYPNTMSIHVTKDITTFDVETISKYATNGDLTLARKLKSFLGCYEEWFANKYVFENCNVKAIYYDGLFDTKNKGLIEHKREYYKNEIKYKFINIRDL